MHEECAQYARARIWRQCWRAMRHPRDNPDTLSSHSRKKDPRAPRLRRRLSTALIHPSLRAVYRAARQSRPRALEAPASCESKATEPGPRQQSDKPRPYHRARCPRPLNNTQSRAATTSRLRSAHPPAVGSRWSSSRRPVPGARAYLVGRRGCVTLGAISRARAAARRDRARRRTRRPGGPPRRGAIDRSAGPTSARRRCRQGR